ncbi:MAG: HAMP domain-containing protein [Gammaproteobacteria bacterium]|nr:HAMP domain-containing protein [Gammaproteobacteria bacterium]
MRKNYPLQITISTLFIVITVILGVILSWQSFNKTSDIMLGSAHDIYERITQELILDFKATYGPLSGGLRQFRLSPVITEKTFAERIAHIEDFEAVLASDSSVFGVGIAYKNGDYLGVASVDSDYVREKYKVPAGAYLIVLYTKKTQAEPGFDAGKMYAVYFDDSLNEIARDSAVDSEFDPRVRPWYQQATDTPSATKPYLFYDSKVVGLTAMSKTKEPGVVVVFDITLANLSQTISKYQVTPSSEVVLINAEGQTFAYKDQQKIIFENPASSDNKKLKLADLNQLGSSVLSYISKNIEAKEQTLDFEYDGRDWIGSARIVAKPGGVDLYALMISPVDELLVDAIAIRWRLIITALVVLLIFIPVIWFTSKKISTPLNILSQEAEAIARFNFTESDLPASFIKEVDQLDSAMESMKSTINKFIKLINSLAGEQDLDALLKSITRETMLISQSDAALIYLLDEQDDLLKADFLCSRTSDHVATENLSALTLDDAKALLAENKTENSVSYKSRVVQLNKENQTKLTPLLAALSSEKLTAIVLPLQNRNDEIIGLLCLVYQQDEAIHSSNIEFIEALSGFAAVTLESRQLFNMQEALLHAFIKLIAGAIDAKSPYTGGHCMRVPEITLMLAKAACDSSEGKYKDFALNDKQWEELSIAGWLHDCGKVTTPEYVVDKATKLETIYDRIHEIRMRFEVLKRDAEIKCWQQIAEGGNKEQFLDELAKQYKELDDDFAFIAECNVGGEFMADEKIQRLQNIADKTWLRTLDDNLGLSWEELNRKDRSSKSLPVEEKILADKAEHLIARHEADMMPEDNPWGFKVDTPEYKYNRGELYNLSVKKGTLSEEERYMINGHMIQTIIMLNNLPYPKSLRNVPLIAGSHHETMDGKGYPKRLEMTGQPETARMMVIADIFEALTASDRPYKKAKTLNESIRILSFMRNDKHIDADLFKLFLTSGVYLEYAKKFLSAEQIDEVNIEDYLT